VTCTIVITHYKTVFRIKWRTKSRFNRFFTFSKLVQLQLRCGSQFHHRLKTLSQTPSCSISTIITFRWFLMRYPKNKRGPQCRWIKYPGSWRTMSWKRPLQNLSRSDDNAWRYAALKRTKTRRFETWKCFQNQATPVVTCTNRPFSNCKQAASSNRAFINVSDVYKWDTKNSHIRTF